MMDKNAFPVIDMPATGENISRLRRKHGQSVRDLQEYFGFEQPQAIYKWQWGKALPSVDNLYALSVLWDEPINGILVEADRDAVTSVFIVLPIYIRSVI
ncbi:MAG: transcriptional regulator [Oscillospiraceae bacterium]|jgi:transcriptional regulator with XRE-family HTH domain|nr:transcriptional regulator [Oscillospiraceae bacterium]